MPDKEYRLLMIELKKRYDKAISENKPFEVVRKLLQIIRAVEKRIEQEESNKSHSHTS